MCGYRKLVSTRPKRLSLFMSPLCFSTWCCTLPVLIKYLLRNERTNGSFWKSHVVCSVESGAFILYAQCDDTITTMLERFLVILMTHIRICILFISPPLASQSTIIGTSTLCTQGCAPEKSLDTCELGPVIAAHVGRASMSE